MTDTILKRYLYVCVYVSEVEPEMVNLFHGLVEKILETPMPDVIPDVHPSCISFKHLFIEATDVDDAYLRGGRAMVDIPCRAFNDYVVLLPADPQ